MNRTPPKPAVDRKEMERAHRVLFPPGSTVEVRGPKTRSAGTISGYFDDPTKLLDAAAKAAERYSASLYWTINRCDPALQARANNRIRERAELTTADHNIQRRVWLLLDIDPRRPSGVGSTDEEHELALEKARRIRAELAPRWGMPIFADSGNGAHLLFRIDLPNDKDSLTLIKAVLIAADKRFSPCAGRHDLVQRQPGWQDLRDGREERRRYPRSTTSAKPPPRRTG